MWLLLQTKTLSSILVNNECKRQLALALYATDARRIYVQPFNNYPKYIYNYCNSHHCSMAVNFCKSDRSSNNLI